MIHALEFFGGVPTLAVPDNTKTAVTRACRYDPDLNPTYQEFAVHYGMGVVPARPYKPMTLVAHSPARLRDRINVGASLLPRWLCALRHNRGSTRLTCEEAMDDLDQLYQPLTKGSQLRIGMAAMVLDV